MSINFKQFLEDYKAGKILVLVNKAKAGDFVMSEFADKNNKRAHQFWTWTGLLMLVPVAIFLLISKGWIYAVGSFILGLVINNAAKKSAEQFVLQNMIENENFWDYALLHKGAIMRDVQGNEITSDFLLRKESKNEIEKTMQNMKKADPEHMEEMANATVEALKKATSEVKIQQEINPSELETMRKLKSDPQRSQEIAEDVVKALNETDHGEDINVARCHPSPLKHDN
jgi:hypothetical protein